MPKKEGEKGAYKRSASGQLQRKKRAPTTARGTYEAAREPKKRDIGLTVTFMPKRASSDYKGDEQRMKIAAATLIAIATFVFVLPNWMIASFGGFTSL
ncbi:MAG: hypothetical protein ACXV5I_08790 [Halobacteriota archaeon]